MDSFFAHPVYFWLMIPALILVGLELYLRRRQWFLVLSRLLWISLLILLVADLTLTLSRQYSEDGDIYVVYDRSDSLALVPERRERVEQFVAEIEAWSNEKNQRLQFFSFAESLQPESSSDLSWGGSKSQIQHLDSLMADDKVNLVVLSDGVIEGNLRSNRPIYSVQVGSPTERDVWISQLSSVMTAFLKNRVEIPVQISQSGFRGQSVIVHLKRGTEILETRELRLDSEVNSLQFSYFPERMGEEVLSVEIEGLAGEISTLNNTSHFRLRTVRDKIRVLHINGKPSMDLKAWRLFLTRQPDVDLVSFYILRSPQDDPEARNRELSLIPFPYEDLFTSELDKFDIVIVQNFNFNLYFSPIYLRNLAQFVRGGGALLFFGGDQSLHNYRGSPLESIFPFQFSSEAHFQTQEVSARVVSSHPLVSGLEWAFETLDWKNFHPVQQREDAEDLVRLSTGAPLLSLGTAGEGRVLVMNTDESWRLHFQPMQEFSPFGRLARRVLQVLTFDPEMEPQRIVTSDWRSGEDVSLSMSDGSSVNWEIRSLYAQEVQTFEQKSEIQFKVSGPDLYEVKVDDGLISQVYETSEQPWRGEWQNLLSRDEALMALSESSGGQFFSFQNRARLFDLSLGGSQIIAAETSPWTRKSKGLSWILLSALLLSLSLDFFLRKRFRWDV